MATVATYVPYSEINNGKPSTLEEFETELSAFARAPMLTLCSALNALLRSDEEPTKQEAHDALVRLFFDGDLADRFLRKGTDVRFVFYRQQILFVAKTAVLYCPDEGILPDAKEFKRLGRIFLMAGDHLPNLGNIPEPLEEKFSYLVAQFLPVQEASGFHRFDHKIARSYLMLNETAPKLRETQGFFDLAKMFEDITGVPLLTFQALLFGALAKFHKINFEEYASNPTKYALSKAWFASTKIAPELIDRFLQLVSATPDQLKDAYKQANWGTNDFTPFRDRPLFRHKDLVLPLDFAFLAEKFEAAPFWTVHSSLPEKERKDLHAFWGRVFEKYGYDVLSTAAGKPLNVCYESPTFVDSRNGQVCDVIMVCGRAAALIELKGSTFSSRAKYGSNCELLRAEIDKKLVRQPDGEAKAVHQLQRSIELICDPEHPQMVNGVDLEQIDRIYPVVITRDDIGSTLGINAYLQLKLDAISKRKGTRKTVTPLFCFNAEDMERLTAYFGQVAFTDLLSAHCRANRERGKYLANPYFATNNNAILREKGFLRPEVHLRSWHALTTALSDQLGLTPE